MEGYSDKCQVWERIATARQRKLQSKQGPQKLRETGYWQVNRELSPLLKGNKFSGKKMSMGLELDCSPESPDETQHTWLTDFGVWDLGRAFFPHRTMIQGKAVASSLVNVWQLLTKQEENNPNKKLHTRQKLIKSKPEGPALATKS